MTIQPPTSPLSGELSPPPPQPYATALVSPAGAGAAQPAATFSAGTLITRTLQVWWANVWRLLGLTALFTVPVMIVVGVVFGVAMFSALSEGRQPDPAQLTTPLILTVVVMFPLMIIYMGAMTAGVIRWAAGQRPSLRELLGVGARRSLVLFGTMLLVMLAVMGGYLLLLVPGIMVGVATAVAMPAVMAEKLGPAGAFKRSLWLTKGFRWSLFAGFLATLGIYLGVYLLTVALNFIPILGALVAVVIQLVISTLPYACAAVAYHDLRVLKEGPDTSALVKVFE